MTVITVHSLASAIDTIWVLLCAALVFIMEGGFAIMYGADQAGLFGSSGFFIGGNLSHLKLNIPIYAYWIFQAAFAMAMASIVSGAVAERMKFGPYIIYTALAAGLIYPVAGHWVWAVGGWLGYPGRRAFCRKGRAFLRGWCSSPDS